ncbi:MAG: response regulator [Flavisolibacter sp.]
MQILVVDDEVDMKLLFEQRFRKEIKADLVTFAFASSGEEALSYLEKHNHEAVLILSDINMPGMTGLELLGHIKKHYQYPPPLVMMITAYNDEKTYNEALKLGADDFLSKPLDFKILKEKLKIA